MMVGGCADRVTGRLYEISAGKFHQATIILPCLLPPPTRDG
jgi:hypothetical protein